MNTKKKSGVFGAIMLSSILASLCCITPVFSLLAGTAGIASTFSWLEPYRPYLIGVTFLVLGFAWYQKLKPKTAEEIACACEEDEKPSFWQSKLSLGIVSVFALLMLAFPYYGQQVYPKVDKQVMIVSPQNIQEIKFNVQGMTCSSCEEHLNHAVNKLPGILYVSANHSNETANVKYDISKTNKKDITDAINGTGYKVTGSNLIMLEPITAKPINGEGDI